MIEIGDLILEHGKLGPALWSPDKKHRYMLTRPLSDAKTKMVVVMQNPSTANADENDNTVSRVIGFAKDSKAMGMEIGSLIVLNMGAGVATDPDDFLKMEDPMGPRNRDILMGILPEADVRVAAWGALNKKLKAIFRLSLGVVKKHSNLRCWGKTKSGDPRHPLYLPAKAELIDF